MSDMMLRCAAANSCIRVRHVKMKMVDVVIHVDEK